MATAEGPVLQRRGDRPEKWWLRPRYLANHCRYLWLRLRRPGVTCLGMVLLGRRTDLVAPHRHGRVIIGAGSHIGNDAALRAHEGTIRIGERCVLGSRVTVNAYLDVHIGAQTLIADDVYIIDFDHRIADLEQTIMDQGIVKAPVRIGHGCWLGTKVVVTKGVRIGDGAVIGAGAVVTRDVPDNAIAAGVPARVIGRR